MNQLRAALVRAPVDDLARAARVRRVLAGVLVLNLVAVALKLVVWRWTDALSIVAEASHSGLDALNNVIALLFARVAVRGPDERHPYGHQKFETLGALVVVGFLSVTVFEIVKGAFVRFFGAGGGTVQVSASAFVLLGVTVLIGAAVAIFERREGHRLHSELLLADAAHTRADVLGTLAVFLGMILVRAGYPIADPVLALVLAVLIGHSGWTIIRRTVPVLVDERAVEPGRVRGVAEDVPGVRRAYSVRSRGRAGGMFVELTIAVEKSLDVDRSHRIADRVEREVADRLGAHEVVVHVEPAR